MPRISSVKKKHAKKPSKNFFENRESVTYEDDVSITEKSAELTKIQKINKRKLMTPLKKRLRTRFRKPVAIHHLKRMLMTS